MAINKIEGFEVYSTTVPVSSIYVVTAATSSLVSGRFGGQAFRIGGSNAGFFTFPVGPSALSAMTFGYAVRLSTLSNNSRIFSFNDSGGNLVCGVYVNSSGAIVVARSTSISVNVLGTSSAGVINTSTWYYLETEFTRNASTGAVNIYLNGSLVLAISSANTGSADITNLQIGGSVTANALNVDMDDIYVTNSATRIGECRVDLLSPTSDDSVQWTPNSGSTNYTQVDDGPSDGDTTYVSSSTPGHVDRYNLSNLGVTPNSTYAVRSVVVARKDDANTRQIRGGIVSGASTSNGTTRSLSTSYGMIDDIWETDPNTSAAWTISALDALKVKIEEIA